MLTRTLLLALLVPSLLLAAEPAWWAERGVIDTAQPLDDYAAANQGQVKNVALHAYEELQARLPGGAGAEVNALIISWRSSTGAADDFAVINVGQLRKVAKPFYDRLIAVGYYTAYPWSATGGETDDYAAANLGQLKNVFSFDVTLDTDGNGLPDWWERHWFGSIGVDPNAMAPGGSGLSNAQAFGCGTDPTKLDTDGDGVADGEDQYPLDPNRSRDVPVTPLAVLDLSPASAPNEWISQIALDDTGHVAYGAHTAGEGQFGDYKVYAGQNAIVQYLQTAPSYGSQVIDDEIFSWYGVTFEPAYLTARGALYLNPESYNVGVYDVGVWNCLAYTNSQASLLFPPNPPFWKNSAPTGDPPYRGHADGMRIDAISETGYCGRAWGFQYGAKNPGEVKWAEGGIIVQNGSSFIFDPALTGIPTGTDVQVIGSSFNPWKMNASGSAIGEKPDHSASLYWDGKSLTTLDHPAVALNDSGQVLSFEPRWNAQGAFSDAQTWLWQAGGTQTSLKDLLPAVFRKQLRDFDGYLLSNVGADPQHTVQIVFTADSLEGPGEGSWYHYHTFLLKLHEDKSSELSIIDPPADSGENWGLKAINASGVLAALGNPNADILANHALLLLPVDITVRKKGTSAAPDDGLILKKGDILEIALAPQYFDQSNQFETLITWQYQQLKSDGTYTDWTAFGADGKGTKFEYTTPAGGVFQVKAIIAVNGEQQEYKLLRKMDEVRNGQIVGLGKKGQPDAFGVVDTDIQVAIRHSAQINLGSHAYDPITSWPPSFLKDSDKCNLFVAHKATDARATVPWINGNTPFVPYPPTANQWAGTDPKNIPGWTLLPVETMPQPGYVVAESNELGSGHCGILDYDGWGIAAGTNFHVSKMYNFFQTGPTTGRQRKYSP